MSLHRDDPIVAIATPGGRGGIGVVRLSFGCWSGQAMVPRFIAKLCRKPDEPRDDFTLVPRRASLVGIHAAEGAAIDRGIALLFAAPQSYTGEDVLELQVHGGPMVLQMIVARCLELASSLVSEDHGANLATQRFANMRLAQPGEFTERAFLNDKLDLAQAEAVADLIEASTEAAVLGAQASLSGAFSQAIEALVDQLIELRALVEATLDFPEEEIEFLEQSDARGRLSRVREALQALFERARQGALLREGLTVVLIGRPNVGKSSLLNAMAEAEVAIVTPIAGTTRDRVEETVRLEGIALHIVDTAGIRELGEVGDARDDVGDHAADAHAVERIGIARTWDAIAKAHVVLHLVDAASISPPFDAGASREDQAIAARLPAHAARRTIVNKIDLSGDAPRVESTPASGDAPCESRIYLSAKTGAGLELLRRELLAIAGWQPSGETGFLARERHLAALRAAQSHLDAAAAHADEGDLTLDLFAEDLRLAQLELDRITGAFTADDLLGEIFGRFCIGK